MASSEQLARQFDVSKNTVVRKSPTTRQLICDNCYRIERRAAARAP